MFCPKCGRDLGEEKKCEDCNYSFEEEKKEVNPAQEGAEGWKRVLGVLLDGFITAIILFFLTTFINLIILIICTGSGVEMSISVKKYIITFFQIILPMIYIINPMLAHSLVMTLFGDTLGNKIMIIKILNADKTKPNRGLFLLQHLLNFVYMVIPFIILVSAIVCMASKEKQLLSDMMFKFRAFDNK